MVRGRTDPIYCKLRHALHSIAPALIGPAPQPSPYQVSIVGPGGDRWTRLFARWRDSVFQLEIRKAQQARSGTGFAIYPGSIATAAHNLEGTVLCHLPSQSLPVPTAYLHASGPEQIDAALAPCAHGATPLPFDRRLPQPGEAIAIIGFASMPLRHPGLGLYVGHVETIRLNYARTLTFIQVSVASAGGLSGSPAFDARGRLIGIVIESVFEQVAAEVPGREYCTILPIQYLLEIDRFAIPGPVPIAG